MHHRHLKDFIITKKTHEDKKRPAAEDKDPYNDYRKAQFFPSVRTYLVWLMKKYLINTAVFFFFFLLLLGWITFVNPFTDECQIIFSFHSSTVHTWRQKVSSWKFQSPKVKNQREKESNWNEDLCYSLSMLNVQNQSSMSSHLLTSLHFMSFKSIESKNCK